METYSYISENGTVRQIEDLIAKARDDEQDVQLQSLDRRTTALEAVKPIDSIIRGDMHGVTSGACFSVVQPLPITGTVSMTLEEFHELIMDEVNKVTPGRVGSVSLTFETELGRWYNFIYIPHRTGIASDNWKYGVLFLSKMTVDDTSIWMQHLIDGRWGTLHKLNL